MLLAFNSICPGICSFYPLIRILPSEVHSSVGAVLLLCYAHYGFWQNLANPTALMLSAVSMLRHLKLNDKAEQIQNAILNTIAEGKHRTADLGGTSTTTDFTKAICDHL